MPEDFLYEKDGAVTTITRNGQFEGVMGQQGQVVEKVYTAQ